MVTVTVSTDGTGDYNCDGIDDQIEINQATSYINTLNGGTIYIKQGIYIVDDSINILSNTILEGDGDLSVIKIKDYATNPPWIVNKAMIEINGDNVIIQNITLDGNFDNQTLSGGASLLEIINVYGDYFTFQNNSMHNTKCDGIIGKGYDGMGTHYLTVKNNYFHNIDHECVSGRYHNSIIENNEVYLDATNHGTNAAFLLSFGDNNIWRNNYIHGKTIHRISTGILLRCWNNNSTSNGIIEGNIMEDQYYSGILFERGTSNPTTDLSKCTNFIIRNNIINRTILYTSTASNGIKIGDTTLWNNFKIENNTINEVAGDGIWIGDNMSNIHMKNNIITNNKRNGIYVLNSTNITSNYNNVYNNTISSYVGITIGTNDVSVDSLFVNLSTSDFHLKSQGGHWNGTTWIQDTQTSPCIEAGDPLSDNSLSHWYPTQQRIEMGAYGNTPQASNISTITCPIPICNINITQV